MVAKSILKENLLSLTDIFAHLSQELLSSFDVIAEIFTQTIEGGHTVFWCGNGGSAAESSHLAAELTGRFRSNRRPLPSISLNSDSSAITCIANDFGFHLIFSRQLRALAREGDILIVLSTSGESENITEVLKEADRIGVESIALLGKSGGKARTIAKHSLIVNSVDTARIQEVHLLLGHTLCQFAELKLGFGDISN
jgi:D-sedoheptulose 7-phosphate isomerase